jgi:hypothetical protein
MTVAIEGGSAACCRRRMGEGAREVGAVRVVGVVWVRRAVVTAKRVV